ncbi:MAG: iron-containing alcohol dehydrogenase [Oscillospiraceae bacterium]|nr:iron-containing alcohol dehydrogenase [Oscillospiraceae bacterium]
MNFSDIDINIKNPCICGKNHACLTKNITIQKNITHNLVEFIKDYFGNHAKGCIICDGNTYKAAENMIKSLNNFCETVKLDIKSYHADEFMAEDCEKVLKNKNYDYFIAAGAGTIHDITRIAAHKRDVPFISYPTAASVDGFVSDIAPLTTKDGMKITLPAVAPVALFADIDVIADAPKRLTASGAGDILGKYIALADWCIANLLTGEYICNPIIKMEYNAVNKLKSLVFELKKGINDRELYEKFCADLLETLIISGICMQYTGNSRPASGSEHHIAHFFEMGIILSTDCLHGENVGVGSILSSGAYYKFAEANNIKFIENYYIDSDLIEKYYKSMYDEIVKENALNSVKNVTPENFYKNLREIKNIISEIPSKEEFAELLGVLNGVNDINGIKAYNLKCAADEIEPLALKLAPYVRNRLTLLKLMRCVEF